MVLWLIDHGDELLMGIFTMIALVFTVSLLWPAPGAIKRWWQFRQTRRKVMDARHK